MQQTVKSHGAKRFTARCFSASAIIAGRLGTAQAAPAKIKFADAGMHVLALGDYGTKGGEGQTAVAKGMASFAKSLDKPIEAVFALGDNFYKKITPDRFDKHFEKFYSARHLDYPFYTCVGNSRFDAPTQFGSELAPLSPSSAVDFNSGIG